jgi:hypothetical protein
MACEASGLNTSEMEAAAWERRNLPTESGTASRSLTPVSGISKPIVAGISERGSISTPRTISLHVIFLILTPIDAPDTQLEITAELAKLFRNYGMTERILKIKSYTEFLALVKSSTVEANPA